MKEQRITREAAEKICCEAKIDYDPAGDYYLQDDKELWKWGYDTPFAALVEEIWQEYYEESDIQGNRQLWAESILPAEIEGYKRVPNGEEYQSGDIYVSIEVEGNRYGIWFAPKMWNLYIHVPAGEYVITQDDTCPAWYNFEAEYKTEGEAYAAIEERCISSSVWAVFFDTPTRDGYVSQENDFTGNWKGSGRQPYTCVGEFDTETEAKAYLKKRIADCE
jgi:hypothetical protein